MKKLLLAVVLLTTVGSAWADSFSIRVGDDDDDWRWRHRHRHRHHGRVYYRYDYPRQYYVAPRYVWRGGYWRHGVWIPRERVVVYVDD